MADFTLAGRHILVTGASSGIGRETAKRLNQAGARISAVARRGELLQSLLEELDGTDSRAYPFDLSRLDQIEGLIRQIVGESGKFDGMMFCAGMAEHVPIKMTKPAYSQKVMCVNYFSFAETLRVLSNAKHSNAGASFVGMSSVSGLQGDKGLFAYSASKGAMNSAVRCAAVELAGRGIRVNAIATGYIGGTGIFESINGRLGEEEVKAFADSNQLLGIGKPEYIADAALYLLSDASKYVTGTIMMVDGGYMA